MASRTGAIRIDEKEILSSVYNPDVIRILNYQKENKSFDPMLWVKPIINRLEQTGSSTYRKFRFDLRLRNYRFFRTRECSESIDCPKKRMPRKHRFSEKFKYLDCKRRGWILEGFPKTRLQAIELKRVGLSPDYLIVLDAPNSVLLGKFTLRWSGKPKKTIFQHVKMAKNSIQ